MAGLAVGFWSDLDEIAKLQKTDHAFSPSMTAEKAKALYGGWISAVAKSRFNNQGPQL
jgi:glycerol kinase